MTRDMIVAPLAGAWIEIISSSFDAIKSIVAPLAGAWIEIEINLSISCSCVSLPLRERGLKYVSVFTQYALVHVAPLAGAWIEISGEMQQEKESGVAPLAGAWIEILRKRAIPPH